MFPLMEETSHGVTEVAVAVSSVTSTQLQQASQGHPQSVTGPLSKGVDAVSVSKRGVKELESDLQFTFNSSNSSLHNFLVLLRSISLFHRLRSIDTLMGYWTHKVYSE